MAEAEQIMNKLRIALTTGNYNHIPDGVSLTLNRLVRYLMSNGHQVLVFAPSTNPPAFEHEGKLIVVPSVSAPGREEYRISCGLPDSAVDELRAFKPDIIHIATPDPLGFQALMYALQRKIPVVASYHTHFTSYLGYYGLGIIESLTWKYLRWFYAQVEHVYVPSPSMVDMLSDHGFHNNMRIWARGIELDRFNPSRRSQAWRSSMGIGPDDVLVTMVSRLVWEKEMDTLRNTFELLHKQYPGVKTMVVGDGPALSEMKATMDDTIFSGHLDGENLARAYASSDIFVFPSISETFGNVTLEALASGVPAVVANAQGNSSLVRHGHHGFLVTPKSHKEFANAIGKLISNPTLRNEFSQNALSFAQQFSWSTILSGLVEDYNDAIRTCQTR